MDATPLDGTVPDPTPVVRRRVYPAEVTLPSGEHLRQALAVVTAGELWVWTGHRELVVREAWEEAGSTLPREWQLDQAPMRLQLAGGLASVRKGRGCGCGNQPLKVYRPWEPWQVQA